MAQSNADTFLQELKAHFVTRMSYTPLTAYFAYRIVRIISP